MATFDFPGISKDNVEVIFQNGVLSVSAETKKSEISLSPQLLWKNFHDLQLPRGVEVWVFLISPGMNVVHWLLFVVQDEQIKATMANGLLTVTYPWTPTKENHYLRLIKRFTTRISTQFSIFKYDYLPFYYLLLLHVHHQIFVDTYTNHNISTIYPKFIFKLLVKGFTSPSLRGFVLIGIGKSGRNVRRSCTAASSMSGGNIGYTAICMTSSSHVFWFHCS